MSSICDPPPVERCVVQHNDDNACYGQCTEQHEGVLREAKARGGATCVPWLVSAQVRTTHDAQPRPKCKGVLPRGCLCPVPTSKRVPSLMGEGSASASLSRRVVGVWLGEAARPFPLNASRSSYLAHRRLRNGAKDPCRPFSSLLSEGRAKCSRT